MSTTLCLWEGKRFPDADFHTQKGVGEVHDTNLAANTPPHTILGDVVGGTWHGPAGGPADLSIGAQLRRVVRVR